MSSRDYYRSVLCEYADYVDECRRRGVKSLDVDDWLMCHKHMSVDEMLNRRADSKTWRTVLGVTAAALAVVGAVASFI